MSTRKRRSDKKHAKRNGETKFKEELPFVQKQADGHIHTDTEKPMYYKKHREPAGLRADADRQKVKKCHSQRRQQINILDLLI